MKPKTLVIVALVVVFVGGIAYALLRELQREEAELEKSISGVVEIDSRLFAQGVADVVKTDRLVLMLVDPQSREPVALRFESPLVPPQTIRIGQDHARRGVSLQGEYLMVGITDKDGEIYNVTPGEVYGRSSGPVALGSEKVRLVLDEPFRGSLFNEATATAQAGGAGGGGSGAPAAGRSAGPGPAASSSGGGAPMMSAEDDPAYTIRGTITVSDDLSGRVSDSDRLIIMLFDPRQARPAAFKIIPHLFLPQDFSIGLPPPARGNAAEGYSLRILTDKNDSPFESAEGEIIGRSDEPIPLGTTGVEFVLDQPYER